MNSADIQQHIAAAADATRIGPFLAIYDEDSAIPHRNYAVPIPGAEPRFADLAELVRFYRSRGRIPRVEYVAPAAGLEAALAAAAIVVDERLPLMADGDLVEPQRPAGIEIRMASTEDELAAAAAAQNDAYGEPETTPADTARLVRTASAGGFVVVAIDPATGRTVGAGLHTSPVGGIVKIAAIGTIGAYRRRGIASHVCWTIAHAARAAGYGSFLEAEGESERRLYARIGFVDVGVAVAASMPADHRLPQPLGGERETMLAFIRYLRDCLVAKLVDLDDEQARRPVVASGTNLLWLVKHVAAVEMFWLHHAFAGEPESVLVDDELQDDDTVESVIAFYRSVGAHTERIVAGAELSTPAAVAPDGRPRQTLAWMLTHLVEETGRHAGHADILRELLDGAAGR